MPTQRVGAGETVTVEGVAETQAAFTAFAKRAAKDEEPATAGGQLVAPAASALAPVRTGALAAAYAVRKRYVVNRLPYAGPVEFGQPARGIAPQFPLTEALDANAAAIEDIYASWIAEQAAAAGFDGPTVD